MNSRALIGAGLILLLGCSTAGRPHAPRRSVAAVSSCNPRFDRESAEEKSNAIWIKHLLSAAAPANHKLDENSALTDGWARSLRAGGDDTSAYIRTYIGGLLQRGDRDKGAFAATFDFLKDDRYKELLPTLTRECDFFEPDKIGPKRVHALGTLAAAHLHLYPRLQDENGHDVQDNPWSGLFSSTANADSSGGEARVPVWLRFSLANPLLAHVGVLGRKFGTEFIPGLGLKFLIDGERSVDLVAMESLAGQGNQQDYFLDEFSPDFSASAPSLFTTGSQASQVANAARYDQNHKNRDVMNRIGTAFAKAMAEDPAYGLKDASQIDAHSSVGPHPFVISLQKLAAIDRFGRFVDHPKRPWRLVLVPAITAKSVGAMADDDDKQRLAQVIDPKPYAPFTLNPIQAVRGNPARLAKDFRMKLAHLRAGDRIYYVVGETQTGQRFRLGELVLDSTPFPSDFADQELFIKHDLEMTRKDDAGSIVEPGH